MIVIGLICSLVIMSIIARNYEKKLSKADEEIKELKYKIECLQYDMIGLTEKKGD